MKKETYIQLSQIIFVFLLIVILLGGISLFFIWLKEPKFEVGDCVTMEAVLERWESYEEDVTFYQILEVGKEKYRIAVRSHLYEDKFTVFETGRDIWNVDKHYNKVDCPAELK